MPKAKEDYPLIRVWGYLIMGSYEYYVEMQLARARKDNAPQDAVYRNEDGTWNRLDDIQNPMVKSQLVQRYNEWLQEGDDAKSEEDQN